MSMRSVSVWQAVLWPNPWAAMPLRHLESNIDHARSRKSGRQGETIWTGSIASGQVGLAWRWLEVRPGVIALADPMNIVSNLHAIGEGTAAIADSRRNLMLNALVHGLPWQGCIVKLLREQQYLPATPRYSVARASAALA